MLKVILLRIMPASNNPSKLVCDNSLSSNIKSILNWGCELTQDDLCDGCKVIVVIGSADSSYEYEGL